MSNAGTRHSAKKPRNPWAKNSSKQGQGHYKGGEYEVIGTVRHSETLEPLTLYRALYGQRGLWVRPAAMFGDSVEIEGVSQPRFRKIA